MYFAYNNIEVDHKKNLNKIVMSLPSQLHLFAVSLLLQKSSFIHVYSSKSTVSVKSMTEMKYNIMRE